MNRYVGDLPGTVTIGAIILANVVLVISLLFAYHPNGALVSNLLPGMGETERSCLVFIDSVVVPTGGAGPRAEPLHPRSAVGIVDGFMYALRNTTCSVWTVVDYFFWFLGLFLKLLKILALPHQAMTEAASALFGTTVKYIQTEAQQSASSSPAHWQQSVLRNKEQRQQQHQNTPKPARAVKQEELSAEDGVVVSYAKYHLKNGDDVSSQCEVEMLTVNDVRQIEAIVGEGTPSSSGSTTTRTRLDMIVSDAFDFDHHVAPNTPIDIYDVVRRTMAGQRQGGDQTTNGLSVALVVTSLPSIAGMNKTPETTTARRSNDFLPLSLVHIHGDFDMVDGSMIADAIGVATWQNKQELLLSLMAHFLDDQVGESSSTEDESVITTTAAAATTKVEERFRLVIDIRGNGDRKSSIRSKFTPHVVETMREDIASSIVDYFERRRLQTSLPDSLTSSTSKKVAAVVTAATSSSAASQEALRESMVAKYLPVMRVVNGPSSDASRDSARMVPFVTRASRACERSGAIGQTANNQCNVAEIGENQVAISTVYSPLLAYSSIIDTSAVVLAAGKSGQSTPSVFLPARTNLDAGMSKLSMALDNDVWDGGIDNDMMFACWFNLFYSSLAMELDAESADERALEMYAHFDRACPSLTAAPAPAASSSTSGKKSPTESPFLDVGFMSSRPNQFDDRVRRLLIVSSKDDSAVSAQSWMSSMVASLFPTVYSGAATSGSGNEDVLTSLSSKRRLNRQAETAVSSSSRDANEVADIYVTSQFLSDEQLNAVGLHMLKSCRTMTRQSTSSQASSQSTTTAAGSAKSGKRTKNSARDAQLIEEVFGKKADASRVESTHENVAGSYSLSQLQLLPRPYDNRRMSYGACVTGAHSLAWHRYWYAHNNSLAYIRRMHEMDKCFTSTTTATSTLMSTTEESRSSSFTFYRRSLNDEWSARDFRQPGASRKSTLFNKIKSMFPSGDVPRAASTAGGVYEVIEEEDDVLVTEEETVSTTTVRRSNNGATQSSEECAAKILDLSSEHFLTNDDKFSWWHGGATLKQDAVPSSAIAVAAKSSGVIFMQQSKYDERCLEGAKVISGRSLQVEKECMFDWKTKAYLRHTLSALDSK